MTVVQAYVIMSPDPTGRWVEITDYYLTKDGANAALDKLYDRDGTGTFEIVQKDLLKEGPGYWSLWRVNVIQ